MPLPRFWYLPRGDKAVVVMTGDDHGNGGTAGRFDEQIADSTPGCNVANWECVRSTSYVYPNTPLTDAQAAAYTSQGFEVGLHVTTDCADWTPQSLANFYSDAARGVARRVSESPGPVTQSHALHRQQRLLDAAARRAGQRHPARHELLLLAARLGPGSSRPLHRFRAADAIRRSRRLGDRRVPGRDADDRRVGTDATRPRSTRCSTTRSVRSATTACSPRTCTPTARRAAAPTRSSSSAQARNVPVVSARQMLDWLDGRNASSFGTLVVDQPRAHLRRHRGRDRQRAADDAADDERGRSRAVLDHAQLVERRRSRRRPSRACRTQCSTVLRGRTRRRTPPTPRRRSISSVAATATPSGDATITWTTNEAFELERRLRDQRQARSATTRSDPAIVTSHSITLHGLVPGTTYSYRVTSTDRAGNSSTSPPTPASPAASPSRRSSRRTRPPPTSPRAQRARARWSRTRETVKSSWARPSAPSSRERRCRADGTSRRGTRAAP